MPYSPHSGHKPTKGERKTAWIMILYQLSQEKKTKFVEQQRYNQRMYNKTIITFIQAVE